MADTKAHSSVWGEAFVKTTLCFVLVLSPLNFAAQYPVCDLAQNVQPVH